MLFVWLFCVGVGMARACLSTAPLAPAAEVAAVAAKPAAALHAGPCEAEPATASPHCRQFCDQAGVSMPTLKATLDQLQAQALMPQVVATVLPLPLLEPLPLPLPRWHGVRAPPIAITFLRLAL